MINFIDWIGWYWTTDRVFYTQGGGGGTSFSKHGTSGTFLYVQDFLNFFKFVIESVSSSLFSNLPKVGNSDNDILFQDFRHFFCCLIFSVLTLLLPRVP